MNHPSLEFIVACSWRDVLGEFVELQAKDYPQIDVRVYRAGVDNDYIPKYGMVSSSVLILNESEAITNVGKNVIRATFMKLAKQAKK